MNDNTDLKLFKNNKYSGYDEELLRQKIEIAKEDKLKLLNKANSFCSKYADEIQEGTKKLALLLSEGKAKGLTEAEILEANPKFYPSVRTPLLNMLYFLNKEYGVGTNVKVTIEEQYTNMDESEIIKLLNSLYEKEEYSDKTMETAKKAPEMTEFIYGNMTHDTFIKIKKLKALSKSKNKQEAFLAYTKCIELCEKYNLEFDRIPCNIS